MESFNTYLKLSPEAQDKAEIEAKLAALNERIRLPAHRAVAAAAAGTPTGPAVTDPATSGTTTTPLPDVRPGDSTPGSGADATAVADRPVTARPSPR